MTPDIYYISCQPANYYYSWQIAAMLLSFEKNGNVDLSKVHIVGAIQNNKIHERYRSVDEEWTKKGVLFAYYTDTRKSPSYISSIRPHILEKHWNMHPYLEQSTFFYHDCDIALTRPLTLHDKLNLDKTCFVSDTASYISSDYIIDRGEDLFFKMCEIVNIDSNEVKSRDSEAGGAQYLIKPGITTKYWQNVYRDSESLYLEMRPLINIKKQSNPEWNTLQIWCADMWAVLWNLWKAGYKTPITKDFDFTWGTSTIYYWDKNAIFHNAGVLKAATLEDTEIGPFYKAVSRNPENAPTAQLRPADKFASCKYYDLVISSYNTTEQKNEPIVVTKQVIPKTIIRKRI